MRRVIGVGVALLLASSAARAEEKTLVERLGRARRAKLLIVHADDLGQSHNINAASIKAFETNLVNNGAILAPCPWVPEIATWAVAHPDFDMGLQFTLTSERANLRWGPLLGRERVPSLVDVHGYFPRASQDVAAHAKIEEAEAELHAQVQKLVALGVHPTYVDSHMGSLFKSRPLFELYLKVARHYKVPALVTKEMVAPGTALAGTVGPSDVVLDGKIGISAKVPADKWADFYLDALRDLRPGVYFLEAHIGDDDHEARAQHAGVEPYGAAWRRRELDFFTSDAFRKALREHDIERITFREIAQRLAGGSGAATVAK